MRLMGMLRWYSTLSKSPGPEQRREWQAIQARGRRSFVWRSGVLGYGGFMFMVMTVIGLVGNSRILHRWTDFAVAIGINLVIWPLAGYFFGLFMWNRLQKRFAGPSKSPPPAR